MTGGVGSQTQIRTREYGRRIREREKANLVAMENKFNSLLEELEYLQTAIQERVTALQMLSLHEKGFEIEDTRDLNKEEALHPSSQGQGCGSMLPSDAGELRGARALDTLLSLILSIEETRIIETNAKNKALQNMHALSNCSDILDETKEIQQILTQRRFAMPNVAQTLENVETNDPAKLLVLKKERNRLHAKLMRDRQRLVKNKLAQAVQNIEIKIESLHRGLAEAHVHIPSYHRRDSGMLDMVESASASVVILAHNDEKEESPPKRVKIR